MKPFLMLTLASTLLSTAALADPATPSPDAMALLTTASTALSKAHSFTADLETVYSYPPPPGETKRHMHYTFESLECLRPNFGRTLTWFAGHTEKKPDGPAPAQVLSDGNQSYIVDNGSYVTRTLKKDGTDAEGGAEGFFNPSDSPAAELQDYRKKGKLHFLRVDAQEQWNGAQYTVVEFEYVDDIMLTFLSTEEKKTLPKGQVIDDIKYYIGPDGLIHRTVDHNNMDWIVDYRYSNIKIDPPVDIADFVLPKGQTPEKPPDALLPDGVDAPDFTVLSTGGKPVRLSDYHGSVVVVDFWATWCGPCQQALPGLQTIAAKYRGRGVVTLAVDVWDHKADFDGWLPEHKQYSALTIVRDPTAAQGEDVASRLYHVSGIPTQYVIDRQGKLVAHFVGYDESESGLESAIKSAL